MASFEDYYSRFPPEARRRESLIQVARIETHLMVEFLTDVRPSLEDSIWVRNASRGPSSKGISALREIQEKYGACHVTTGNAQPPRREEIGIYVRSDVLENSPNLLSDHLSR